MALAEPEQRCPGHRGGQARRAYKDCTHLVIADRFTTTCNNSALEYPRGYYDDYAVQLPTSEEPRCPKDCRFFEDRAQLQRERRAAETRARWRARLKWPINIATRFVAWYGKAPWQTQVLLLLVALVILAPWYAKALAEVLKAALHGK